MRSEGSNDSLFQNWRVIELFKSLWYDFLTDMRQDFNNQTKFADIFKKNSANQWKAISESILFHCLNSHKLAYNSLKHIWLGKVSKT